jgi:hypothetical protein
MRLIIRSSAIAGIVLFLLGTVLAYANRNGNRLPATVVLVLATLCVLGATALYTRMECRPGGLIIPEQLHEVTAKGTRLPEPAWWAPVGAAGLIDMTVGALAGSGVVVMGALLVGAATTGVAFLFRRTPGSLDRRTVQLARWIRAFGAAHAKDGDATIEGQVLYVGRNTSRVVFLGADGHFGDLTAPSYRRAKFAATLSGMTIQASTTPQMASRWVSGAYEWDRMAGIQIGGPAAH